MRCKGHSKEKSVPEASTAKKAGRNVAKNTSDIVRELIKFADQTYEMSRTLSQTSTPRSHSLNKCNVLNVKCYGKS